uniref:Uncharacterized protein n=1 Tax=Timema douglasi TaxID=61478 RepID=A0A7R8ZCA0_TIMDO|nr:unnamed protein product [Timema douglasi]
MSNFTSIKKVDLCP